MHFERKPERYLLRRQLSCLRTLCISVKFSPRSHFSNELSSVFLFLLTPPLHPLFCPFPFLHSPSSSAFFATGPQAPRSREENSRAMYLHSSRQFFSLAFHTSILASSHFEHGSQTSRSLRPLEELSVTQSRVASSFPGKSATYSRIVVPLFQPFPKESET